MSGFVRTELVLSVISVLAQEGNMISFHPSYGLSAFESTNVEEKGERQMERVWKPINILIHFVLELISFKFVTMCAAS